MKYSTIAFEWPVLKELITIKKCNTLGNEWISNYFNKAKTEMPKSIRKNEKENSENMYWQVKVKNAYLLSI